MSEHPHILALKEKHRALDGEIQRMERHPGADHFEIAGMKRQKLKLREEIEALS